MSDRKPSVGSFVYLKVATRSRRPSRTTHPRATFLEGRSSFAENIVEPTAILASQLEQNRERGRDKYSDTDSDRDRDGDAGRFIRMRMWM